MKHNGFSVCIFIIFIAVIFSINGCLSVQNDARPISGFISVSDNKDESKAVVKLMWYDPFGTISFQTKDGKVAEVELSFGYDISDREFLPEFSRKLRDVHESIILVLSKYNSEDLNMTNYIDLENNILKSLNKVCGKSCKIIEINLVRLEIL